LLKVLIHFFLPFGHSEDTAVQDRRVLGLRRAPGSGSPAKGAVPPKQQDGKVHKGFRELETR